MAKKKNAEVDTSGARPLTHSPFAALAPAAPRADVSAAPPAPAPSGAIRFPPKLVVRRETKGRGGKTITRISGVPEVHREELADRMKRALGCGATIEAEDVLLLGSLADRAVDWLVAQGAPRVVRGS